ncbi:MAG: hypothetical protein MUF81_16790 [Verrucomicrobia bacterium]|jgi:hypothetical protein|nr:hypothetical protein [Verrucomicrobiota bacterium]
MKTKIVSAVIAVTATLVWQVAAQTNSPSLVTNLVAAHPDFRRVNGQLYNVEKSVLWQKMDLQFVRETEGVVIARRFTREPVYESQYYPPSGGGLTANQSIGAYAPGPSTYSSGGYRKVQTGTTKVFGATIALRNCRQHVLTTGKEFTVTAMRAGTYEKGAGILQLWDNGETNWVQVVTSNSKIKP